MSRIGGIINEMMNNRTIIKERQINNRFIDLLNKQRIIVPLILDMYGSSQVSSCGSRGSMKDEIPHFIELKELSYKRTQML